MQAAIAERPRTLVYTAAAAGIMGAVTVVIGGVEALGGETPAIGRVLLGLLGMAGAALLWTQPRYGWLVCLLWAVLQIPYIAWNVDGSPLSQTLYFPLSVTSETRVNGEVTSFSEYGINLVGVLLTILIARWRTEWQQRQR
jgi:hypothetical protein